MIRRTSLRDFLGRKSQLCCSSIPNPLRRTEQVYGIVHFIISMGGIRSVNRTGCRLRNRIPIRNCQLAKLKTASTHVIVRCCALLENRDQKSIRMTHSATQINLIAPSRDRLDDLSGTEVYNL
jgi:hypothetical protein